MNVTVFRNMHRIFIDEGIPETDCVITQYALPRSGNCFHYR